MIEKEIYGQDGYYKLEPKKSGETSINLSGEIANYIKQSNIKEQDIYFNIYKEDFYKAIGHLINILPLYTSSSKESFKIDYNNSFFSDNINTINSFFGSLNKKQYKANLLIREDGRFYLNKLDNNGFNIRRFLIVGHSKLVFDKQDNELILRLKSYDLSKDKGNTQPSPSSFTPTLSQTEFILQHSNLLNALRTKPFVLLAGISGTGKSRIVRELAYASCPKELQDEKETTPGNYCMVEVKPNWHDSSELLGYYSSISKKYFLTKFVHFIYKAIQYPNVPFFVCLDEMNLAPVEQYFAEFLSVLETRKMVDGKCVSEQLIKKKEFEKCQIPEELDDSYTNTHIKIVTETYYSNEELEIISYLKDNGLILPENVFVIGTVNMDDTTHQFSRKVIDRAMTIEMNGGNLENMFGGSKKLNYVSNPLPLDAFKSKYINADEVLEVHQDCAEQIKKQTVEKLNSINNILKDTPFIVSYRVLNELVIYLGNLLDDNKYQGDGNDEEFSKMIDNAITDIVMMKILPRIEGDSELLDDKLEQLIKMFNNSDSEIYKKLTEMNNRLKNLSYTRFWA